MSETQLRDVGQYPVRNQLAGVPGASVPPPFGGKYRQIMIYVDPAKLESYELSPMDVVRAVNNANLILPVGRRQDRPDRLQPVHQQPVSRDPRHQPDSAQDRRALDGDRRRHRPRRGRAPDSEQRGDGGRPAVGLPAGDEAGRRYQHHRGGRRHPEHGRPPGRRAEGAEPRRGVRSVAVREARDRDAAARRRHRAGADRDHGAGVSRQLPRDDRGVPLDPAVGARRADCALHRRELDQHDDPRRLCAGVLPADRQRRDRAGEHLPAHGDGRDRRRSRRRKAATKWRWRCWRPR